MTSHDPDLDRLGDALLAGTTADLARQERACDADRAGPARASFLRPPRILAGGTLGLAGVGAALLLVLSAGGAAAPPAFAITSQNDGSLAINLDSPGQGLVGTNNQLAKMGDNEHIEFKMAPGPAPSSGAVDCVTSPQGATIAGPAITLTVGPGDSNSETIASGNTGAGTWHVASCQRFGGAETMHFVPGPKGSWDMVTVSSGSGSSDAVPVLDPRRASVLK